MYCTVYNMCMYRSINAQFTEKIRKIDELVLKMCCLHEVCVTTRHAVYRPAICVRRPQLLAKRSAPEEGQPRFL